jgi:hypothetical protein
MPVYEIPHSDLLDLTSEVKDENEFEGDLSFIETTNKMKSKNEWKFEPDYSFIELINSKALNSPWKAKAHEGFKGKSEKHMKNLLGLTRFKEKKIVELLEAVTQVKEKKKIATGNDDEGINDMEFLQIQSKSKTKIFSAKPKANSKSNDFLPKFEEDKDSSIFDDIGGPNVDTQYSGIESNFKFLDSKIELSNGAMDPESLCKEKNEYGIIRCLDWRNNGGVNYDTPVKKQG